MPKVTGTVDRVSSKKLASGVYYSFCVDDEWYRTNRTRPPFEEGYQVQFVFNEDKYGKQVDMDSIKFKEGEAPPKGSGGKSSGGGISRDQYWSNKEVRDIDTQVRITYQSATNTALAFVTAALDKGVIDLPKSKKAADRLALFRELVNDETWYFFSKYHTSPALADEVGKDAEEDVEVDEPAAQPPVEEVIEDDEDDGWN